MLIPRVAVPFTIFTLAGSAAYAQPCAPVESQIMVADDGDVGDGYGWSVDIDANTAVVSSIYEDAIGSDSGSVYVLEYNGTNWDQVQKLVPIGIGSADRVGNCVAIDNNTIVIGASGDDDAGSGAGAAYVYTKVDGTWTQATKLVPPMLLAGDNCASAVDIDNDTIILSASLTDTHGFNSGAAYIYRKIKGEWTFEAQLFSDDIAEFDRFGKDVSVSGNRVLISADSDDDNGPSSGSAYIFERSGTTWTQTAKLIASDGDPDDQFGECVSLSGSTALIGSRYDNVLGGNSGSAYIFEYNGTQWQEDIKLFPFDGTSSEYFGQNVAIHNNRAVIGSWGVDDPFGFFNAGAAYIYSRTNGAWSLDAKIIASDQEGGDFFGYGVGITDDHAIIGADGNDDFWWGPDAGAAYLIDLNCAVQCPADLTNDGSLNFLDVSAFLAAFGNQDPIADFEADGSFNFLDVSAFLAAFGVGCP